jgi:hypothetical protein
MPRRKRSRRRVTAGRGARRSLLSPGASAPVPRTYRGVRHRARGSRTGRIRTSSSTRSLLPQFIGLEAWTRPLSRVLYPSAKLKRPGSRSQRTRSAPFLSALERLLPTGLRSFFFLAGMPIRSTTLASSSFGAYSVTQSAPDYSNIIPSTVSPGSGSTPLPLPVPGYIPAPRDPTGPSTY